MEFHGEFPLLVSSRGTFVEMRTVVSESRLTSDFDTASHSDYPIRLRHRRFSRNQYVTASVDLRTDATKNGFLLNAVFIVAGSGEPDASLPQLSRVPGAGRVPGFRRMRRAARGRPADSAQTHQTAPPPPGRVQARHTEPEHRQHGRRAVVGNVAAPVLQTVIQSRATDLTPPPQYSRAMTVVTA